MEGKTGLILRLYSNAFTCVPLSFFFLLKASASSQYNALFFSKKKKSIVKNKAVSSFYPSGDFFQYTVTYIAVQNIGYSFCGSQEIQGKENIHPSLIFWMRKYQSWCTLGPVCIYAVILTHVLVSFYKDQWKSLYSLAFLLLHKVCFFCNQSLW